MTGEQANSFAGPPVILCFAVAESVAGKGGDAGYVLAEDVKFKIDA